MSINPFSSSWTPITLSNALQECSTNDTKSALTAVIVLCHLVGKLQSRIENLEAKLREEDEFQMRLDALEDLLEKMRPS